MQENKQTIELIITQIIKINEKYQEIQKIKGENFNIFSILKLERNEVKTHSNFIYELLNPEGTHNQGNLFLKLFFKIVLKLKDYGSVINVFQEDFTSENRRIDFVIKTEKYKIGIEMKIDARDQTKQLLDYKKELDKSNKEIKLYYLTLTGYEATEKSTNNELKVDEDYFLLSFKEDIYNWLEECIEKSATIPLLREGITHYKNLISKITNKISEPMESEMNDLISTPKQVEAVQLILNEYPKIWAKKEMEFWEKLEKNLHEYYLRNTYELRDIHEIWIDDKENKLEKDKVLEKIENLRNKKYGGMGFALEKEYDNNTSTYLTLVYEGTDNIYLYLSFFREDGERLPINNALNKICDNINFTDIWDTDERYKKIDKKIIFYSRYKTEPTYDLFDNSKLEQYIEIVVKEVENTIKSLVKNEKSIIKALSS